MQKSVRRIEKNVQNQNQWKAKGNNHGEETTARTGRDLRVRKA